MRRSIPLAARTTRKTPKPFGKGVFFDTHQTITDKTGESKRLASEFTPYTNSIRLHTIFVRRCITQGV